MDYSTKLLYVYAFGYNIEVICWPLTHYQLLYKVHKHLPKKLWVVLRPGHLHPMSPQKCIAAELPSKHVAPNEHHCMYVYVIVYIYIIYIYISYIYTYMLLELVPLHHHLRLLG